MADKVKEPVSAARITLNIPAQAWEELCQAAAEDGTTRSESLRRAIWAYLLFRARVRAGCTVEIQHPNERTEWVAFPGL
jgi:metal-responsive CopG/Arc/MetJ family transcriptional regulator